jgi:hypothetical protein
MCALSLHTWSETALVNPAVNLCALLLQLLDPSLGLEELRLKLRNALRVRAYGLVEGLGKHVGHGLDLARRQLRVRLGHVGHGGGVVAVGQAARVGVLRGLGSWIHFCVVSGRGDCGRALLLLRLARRVGALVEFLGVVRLRALRCLFDVAVGPRSAFEEHFVGEKRGLRESEGGGLIWRSRKLASEFGGCVGWRLERLRLFLPFSGSLIGGW